MNSKQHDLYNSKNQHKIPFNQEGHQSIPITDNRYSTVTPNHSIPKESKALLSFLNRFGTETKLQSFSLKDIFKGSWDFT